jgi:phosphatidylethanolamine-binding protein (PEBP) family uncharacterized protein
MKLKRDLRCKFTKKKKKEFIKPSFNKNRHFSYKRETEQPTRRNKLRRQRQRQLGGGLDVIYNKSTHLINNNTLPYPLDISSPPIITLSRTLPGHVYLIILYDPDAMNYTHYLFTINHENVILKTFLTYRKPTPPKGTGVHHYTFDVYDITNKEELLDLNLKLGKKSYDFSTFYKDNFLPLLKKLGLSETKHSFTFLLEWHL